jgi:dihydrodipicolinate synthase
MEFSGSYVAIVTPWTKDCSAIDYGAYKDLIEWQIASGTDGILPAGTTGESPTLTHEEHNRLIAKTVEFVAGRCKVMAGAGSNSTAETLSLARHAVADGVDSVLIITPYYNRPTQEGLYGHFAVVAEEVNVPIMIYNIPSRTGVNMLPETVARVYKAYPHVCGIKEATGNVDQASRLLSLVDMDVMSGDDSLALPIMSVGGTGVVSVIANIVPEETKRMVSHAADNDFAKAREIHYRLMPLMKACFVETNPGPVKAALRIMGKCDGALRLPMVEPCPESEKILRDALGKVDLV